jgi:branched-chain amino acid transport system substrate-binding protein
MSRLLSRMKVAIMLLMVLSLATFSITAAGQQEVDGEGPIKLAGMYNLTGGFSSIDAPGLNGAQLKAKLINEQGGVLDGRMIEVVGYDTQSDQQAAATQAKKALDQGVVAGLGYGDTTFVMAAAPLFQNAGIPFVTSGATHPELPKWVGDMFFMVPFGDDDQSFAIADYAWNELGVRKVVVWTDDSMDFTLALSKFFRQRFQELGGEIIHEVTYQTGDTDFSAHIARLREADADAVFVGSIPNEAGLTVKQIREAGINIPIISADGFDTELVSTVPGPDLANDVYFSTHTYRGDDRPEVNNFVSEYQDEYGRDPENAFAALGFDAVGLIADAIERAGTTEGKALQKALAETMDYQGVTGKIAYTRPSRVPEKPVAIIGVQNGNFDYLKTWWPGD